jgi:hypothetical protein
VSSGFEPKPGTASPGAQRENRQMDQNRTTPTMVRDEIAPLHVREAISYLSAVGLASPPARPIKPRSSGVEIGVVTRRQRCRTRDLRAHHEHADRGSLLKAGARSRRPTPPGRGIMMITPRSPTMRDGAAHPWVGGNRRDHRYGCAGIGAELADSGKRGPWRLGMLRDREGLGVDRSWESLASPWSQPRREPRLGSWRVGAGIAPSWRRTRRSPVSRLRPTTRLHRDRFFKPASSVPTRRQPW